MVETLFNPPKLGAMNLGEVSFLGQEAADEADRILDRALFPRMMWLTEEGPGSQVLVDPLMLHIFGPVVVGDRSTDPLRKAGQCPVEASPHGRSGSPGEALDLREPSLSFHDDLKCRQAASGDDGVGFPMSGLQSSGHDSRTTGDRNPLGDMGLGVLSTVAPLEALAVRPGQEGDEVTGLSIDPLVNRLIADAPSAARGAQSAGDELRGPADPEANLDKAAKGVRLKAPTSVRTSIASIRSRMSSMRPIASAVDRGSISLELSREGGRISTEFSGDRAQRPSLGPVDRQLVPFFFTEVSIPSWHSRAS